MAQLIYGPSTAGGRSRPIIVVTERHVTLISTGLAGAESADVQISPDNGQTWVEAPQANMDLNNNTRALATPGLYSVNVPVTGAATSIYAANEENP